MSNLVTSEAPAHLGGGKSNHSRWVSRVAQGKESTCDAEDTGDPGSIPGLGRSPGGGYDRPLQYSCLENPMDRGAWQATVHRVTESGVTEATEP